ncbi:hypothetical protein F1D05_23500 [Kribbella qitaiheensis]|uniref:LapA family protein n=1 Tax=Kribbella qitaiheensis TaxID=1544730 RepID=A0A7G6X264_9ACTN|nr:hypothetical protein [Kribbella qitaiheensis]QNE20329.1 hypothetical protein F1D05_23500 [Kribbella qitaiheensis]
MLALGIVLIVLAVLFGLGVSVSSGDSTRMSVFGVDFGLSVPTLFFLGAAAGIALFLGLWLMKKGLGRGYRRHKEVKELRQQVATTPSATEPTGGATATTADHDETDGHGDRHSHHADVDADESSRTVDLDEADRLATDRHIVAEGTENGK